MARCQFCGWPRIAVVLRPSPSAVCVTCGQRWIPDRHLERSARKREFLTLASEAHSWPLWRRAG